MSLKGKLWDFLGKNTVSRILQGFLEVVLGMQKHFFVSQFLMWKDAHRARLQMLNAGDGVMASSCPVFGMT